MAYTVTDQAVYNELQYHLLEAANSGASYGSGLFAVAEVVDRVQHRLSEFLKDTGVHVVRSTATSSTANVNAQSTPSDVLDVVRVGFPNSSSNTIPVPRGSALDSDLTKADNVGSNAAQDVPDYYTYDDAAIQTISFFPPPSASRAIDYLYVPQPTALPATPDGTVLDCPDDFTPFIKYGALADLFSKNGETHDPTRAAICEQLYQLGIDAARLLVSHTPDNGGL
jgi:hypothetical protein